MARPIIHGLRRRGRYVPEYPVWQGVKSRCLDITHDRYPAYGGQGITICSGWANSFVAFYLDLHGRPSKQHTLDRIDNAGGYWCGHCDECKSLGRLANCRWATKIEQALNRSDNNRLTFKGVTRCESEWADLLKMPRGTLRSRLSRGYSVEQALTIPVNSRRAKHVPNSPSA